MGLPPLIERELRIAARSPRTYRFRLISGILTSLVGIGFILPGSHNIALVGTASRGVFWWMSGMMLAYGMMMALFLAADSLTSERRERTLELLQLTRLTPFEILIGKLVATGTGAIQGILACSLTLSLAILAGGVTLMELASVIALGLNSIFLALATGLLASCFAREGRTALLLGLILLGIICALPLATLPPTSNTITPTAPPSGWALFSPLTSFQLCDPISPRFQLSRFVISLLMQHLLSWGILGLAGKWLRSHWRTDAPNQNLKWRAFLKLDHSPMSVVPVESEDTKNENPISWLLILKYGNRTHRLAIGLGLIAVSGILFVALARMTSSVEAFFAVLISWHLLTKLWVGWIACHLMTEMRRSGMLELTLTTPLDWDLILDGWLIGLKRIFLPPIALLIGVDLLASYFASDRLTLAFGNKWWLGWMFLALSGLIVDTYALAWLGLRWGLTARNTTRAWLISVGIILFLPWFGIASLMAITGVGFVSGISVGSFDLIISRIVFGLLITIGSTAWAIDQLRAHLRENLASP